MKKFPSILIVIFLALCASACGIAKAGGTSGNSSQGPVNLSQDNPLADVGIDKVTLKLTGVAEVELAELDAQTIIDIVQNEGRTLVDRSAWDLDSLEWLISEFPPHFFLTLDSGEELRVSTSIDISSPTGSLVISGPNYENYEYYDLSKDEYQTFVTVYKNVALVAIDSTPVSLRPFEDLTADQLAKVTRTPTMLESASEQVLTEEQVDSLVQTLNKLEISPSTVDLDPPDLLGGGYENFVLWFENGERVSVGQFLEASRVDEDGNMTGEDYPAVWIDGVTYECDRDSAEVLNWKYEEWARG